MADGPDFVAAFERNCPHVRMKGEERAELYRLFYVAEQAARRDGMIEAGAAIVKAAPATILRREGSAIGHVFSLLLSSPPSPGWV